MKKVFPRLIQCTLVALTVALCLVLAVPGLASAQSPGEYYTFSFDAQFSKNQVTESESFTATITAGAACIQNFPVSATEASITSRIVAENQANGARVTLNSGYTLTIDDFPSSAGENTSVEIIVPLQFPAGSVSGTYNVIAELVEAKVKAIIWIPVTSYLASEQTAGTITYTAGG
ncbi:hypothetical protein ACFLTR_02400, partial [Chloroflexota bacterium]